MSSSDRRFSINDIELPSNLKELNKQDDATFFQYFEGLQLEDVSSSVFNVCFEKGLVKLGYVCVISPPYASLHTLR